MLVNQLKHQHRLAAAIPIASAIVDQVRAQYAIENQSQKLPIDLLVPVPLHRNRLRHRGFNQALEVGRLISKTLEINLARNHCIRLRDTPAQQQLDLNERKRNLNNAFWASPAVKGKQIAIIDDVVTTGTTANSVAKALLRVGAHRCDIWCFARTTSPN